MGEFFHAVKVFGDQLADVGWFAVAIALTLQLAKLFVRSIAWRNILKASYPETAVPRRPVLGAYLAGVGVNSIIPGRAGDVVKIYLVHRRIEGTTYTTLASTLVTETLLDLVLALSIFLWALTQGVLRASMSFQRCTRSTGGGSWRERRWARSCSRWSRPP